MISLSTAVRNNSMKVRKQFQQSSKDNLSVMGMKSFLFELNTMLIKISEISQWDQWRNSPDGKSVMREVDKIYNDNLNLMKKY
jgi:hypothetical protein